MRSLPILMAMVGLVVANSAHAFPTHRWSHAYGDSLYQSASRVVSDANGSVFAMGHFRDFIDLGGGPLTAASAMDVWLAKLDEDGNHIWSMRVAQSAGTLGTTFLTTTSTGSLVLTGSFRGTIDFGGGPLSSVGPGGDIFAVVFNADGDHQWSARYGDGSDQTSNGVVVDSNDDIIIAAQGLGPADFGGGNLGGGAGGRMFLVKLGATGSHVWSKQFGVGGAPYPRGVAVDPLGNIAVTGILNGTVNFGGGVLSKNGLGDVYVVSFDSNGNHRWSGNYGNASEQSGASIATDASGNVLVTGYFFESIDFGGGVHTSLGDDDLFLAKFASNGTLAWSRSFGNPLTQYALLAGVDDDGNIILHGRSAGVLDLGDNRIVYAGTFPVRDFFAAFDDDGSALWCAQPSPTTIGNIALAPDRGILLCGGLEFSVNFGGGALTSGGSSDAFVVSLQTPEITPVGPSQATATLQQNFPNPFNPTTTIAYSLSEHADVAIEIFDVTGARVRLLNQGARDAGNYVVEWNGRDDAGRPVGSGVYFYRLEGVAGVAPKKMVLLK